MTLHKYILSQLFWPACAVLMALNGLFLVVQLLKAGEMTFGAGFSWSDLLHVSALFLPGFAMLTIPISVLAGILLGFGRMTEEGELMAMSAAGVSPWRLLTVPLVLGLGAGLVAALVAGWTVPAAADALHAKLVSLAKRHVIASLEPGRFFEEVPRVMLYPHRSGSEPNEFDGFLLYDHRPGKVRHALLASKATLKPMGGGNRIELELESGEVHVRNPSSATYSVAGFERATIGLDIDRLIYDRTKFIPSLDRLSLAELGQPPPDLPVRERKRYGAAFHRRFAFPAACLVFALLGTMLGLTGRLAGRKKTLVVALATVSAYYLLVRLADVLIDRGIMAPGPATWAPNVLLFGLVSVWLVRRTRVAG